MIDDLPSEVQTHILIFINSAEDLLSLQYVSKHWFVLSESRDLWKRFCLEKHKIYRLELYDDDWKKCYNLIRATSNYPVNRIVVHSINGNYLTIAPDGTNTIVITSDHLETSRYYGQATWSPHGDKIAIAQYRVNSNKSNVILYNTKSNLICQRFETPQHPFYFYWSPDNTRLTFLSNWPIHSIAMHSIDLSAKSPILRSMGDGRPYYYSMNPSGREELISHVSLSSIDLLSLSTGFKKRIMHSYSLGSFSAPNWISDNEFIYVSLESGEGSPQLVMSTLHNPLTLDTLQKVPIDHLKYLLKSRFIPFSDADNIYDIFMREIGGKEIFCTEKKLASIINEETEVDFVASPDAHYVAYSDGALFLVDLVELNRNKDYEPVFVHRLAIAFFWSPNSRYLIFISQSRLDLFSHHYQWWVYDTHKKESYKLTDFSASAEFRQHYLPFYSQYALSLTFFSPDSNFFVYVNDSI